MLKLQEMSFTIYHHEECLWLVLMCIAYNKVGSKEGPLTLKFDRATWSFLKIDSDIELP